MERRSHNHDLDPSCNEHPTGDCIIQELTARAEAAEKKVAAVEAKIKDAEDREDNINPKWLRAALAAADKAVTITTHEQSGELPLGTEAISDDGDLWERLPSGWAGVIHETGSEPWVASGCEEPALPARVIHWGTE